MSPFIQTLTALDPNVAIATIDQEIAFFENEGMPQVVASLKQDKQTLLMSLEDM